MNLKSLQTALQGSISTLPENKYQLFVVKPEDSENASGIILNQMAKKGRMKGICISMESSSEYFEDLFEKWHIDSKNIFFIRHEWGKSGTTKNTHYLESKKSFVELSLAINDLVNTGEYDFIFLDSIQSWMVYNSALEIENFLAYLIGKLSEQHMYCLATSIDSESSSALVPIIRPLWHITDLLLL